MNTFTIKNILLTLFMVSALVFSFGAVATLSAAPTQEEDPAEVACTALEALGEACSEDGKVSQNKIVKYVKAAINILSWIVGLASVIMIIIGGLRYVTAAGEASNVQSAKNTIMYALIGLIIVAIAQSLVFFVLSKIK